MSRLNSRQRSAAQYTDGPLLVLAGAGSGKTRVITHKIAHLIEKGMSPAHIAAVTFTNKAAREMQSRVRNLLTHSPAKGLRISTFHAMGMTILRRDGKYLGYQSGFSVFDGQDSMQLIDELTRKSRLAIDAGAVRNTISHWKNELVLPEQAIHTAEDDFGFAAAQLYTEYQRYLKACNTLDFDDLILQPVSLLREYDNAINGWRERIRHLLVDEYQDTNLAQYELVRLIAGDKAKFTVVGDDDQSIYAWRGARPDNLQRLGEDYPTLKVIKLEQNYRSTGCILKCANELIGHNPHIFSKRLWSELGYGSTIRVMACKDPEHEAERVVSELLHQRFTSGIREGDFAILYRGNHQSRPFERVLREHGIPYTLSGGMSFFEYSEIKDILAYLRLLVNPSDNQAFLRIVNTPRRELGAVTLEKLALFSSDRGLGFLEACLDSELDGNVSKRALGRLREFAQWISRYTEMSESGSAVQTVQTLVDDIGFQQWLFDTSSKPEDAERRWQNIEVLIAWFRQLEKKSDDASLADLVNRMQLLDILDRNEDEAQGNAVHLMTLHAAKGLEFPHVFLVGMDDDTLPHHSCVENDTVEEERRLAYVGITRAQQSLRITFPERRKRYGEWLTCEPSRFLAELPGDDLEWQHRQSSSGAEDRQNRGRAHLENLRDLLS